MAAHSCGGYELFVIAFVYTLDALELEVLIERTFSRCAIRVPDPSEKPGVHHRRGSDAGDRYRRQYRHFQLCGWRAAEAASLRGAGPHRPSDGEASRRR